VVANLVLESSDFLRGDVDPMREPSVDEHDRELVSCPGA
jgi:hypothetical protein